MSKPDDDDITWLVSMRADDASEISRDSVFTHSCSKCGKRVVLAPSGVRFQKENPDARIICNRCCASVIPDLRAPDVDLKFAASTPEELKEEASKTRPNPWKSRN